MIFICQETFPEHGRPHELLPDAQCLRGGPRREEGVSFGYWENILQKVPKYSCVPGSCTPSCTTARCSSISSDRCQSVFGENYFVSQSNKNPVMCLFVMWRAGRRVPPPDRGQLVLHDRLWRRLPKVPELYLLNHATLYAKPYHGTTLCYYFLYRKSKYLASFNRKVVDYSENGNKPHLLTAILNILTF